MSEWRRIDASTERWIVTRAEQWEKRLEREKTAAPPDRHWLTGSMPTSADQMLIAFYDARVRRATHYLIVDVPAGDAP